MKICLAQTRSLKGDIQKNIQNHLNLIEQAIEVKADLIIFPELSITGYEPTIAKDLACEPKDAKFKQFQELSDKGMIAIGIGMPTMASDGINISMLIFQRQTERLVYTKCLLHDDELPYFVSGKNQPTLTIKGKKIALGICYETLQKEHFATAAKKNADLFIASVAKTDRGITEAFVHFPSMAQEFRMPVMMVNSVGYCDNFMSTGNSSVWDEKGELVAQLDDKNQGFLIYNSDIKGI